MKIRRTQEERSASTRALLLDATLQCLIDVGYAATTTSMIADRAGVSRGAQLHHFPTKAELVIVAVDHLSHRLGEELAADLERVPPGAERLLAFIDWIWGHYSAPLFSAWLELSVASRHDPDLRAALRRISRWQREEIERQSATLFPEGTVDDARFQRVISMTDHLLKGMAMQRALDARPTAERNQRERAVLHDWRAVVLELLNLDAPAAR